MENDWPTSFQGSQGGKIRWTSAHFMAGREHTCRNRGSKSLLDEPESTMHKLQEGLAPLRAHSTGGCAPHIMVVLSPSQVRFREAAIIVGRQEKLGPGCPLTSRGPVTSDSALQA